MKPSWVIAGVLVFFACGSPSTAPVEPNPGADFGIEPADGGAADAAADEPDGDEAVRIDSVGGLGAGRPRLQLTMLDVGQGDGLLVQLPGGKVLAVDSGPSPTGYGDALRALGVLRLDYAILSHAHADHYSGLPAVLAALMPADCLPRVFDPGLERTDAAGYREFRSAAGCRYQKVGIGQTLNLDPDVEVAVLSAYDQRFGDSDDSHGINNTSVVTRLRYHRFSALLSGDAEQAAEQALALSFPMLLRSTVLKAAHHGSCTSSGTTFLQLVAPQYLLMSLAASNPYGMPHCQTMAKLSARPGLGWARTDVNGTAVVTTDGTRYAVTLGRGPDRVASCPRDCAAPLDF
jgi:competence protein ComEC